MIKLDFKSDEKVVSLHQAERRKKERNKNTDFEPILTDDEKLSRKIHNT